MTTVKIRKQPADPKIRLIELWRCGAAHEFGFDPSRPGAKTPVSCPTVIGQAANGKWLGCPEAVARVRVAGTVST